MILWMLGLMVLLGAIRVAVGWPPRSFSHAVKRFFFIDLFVLVCVECYAAMDIEDEP